MLSTCEVCRYSHVVESTQDKKWLLLECRRYAPVVIVSGPAACETRFPMVSPIDGCGDYEHTHSDTIKRRNDLNTIRKQLGLLEVVS